MPLALHLSSKTLKAVSETVIGHYWYVALTVFSVALYGLYLWLLPKPLPGIPYNPSAITSLFGDVPEMMKEVAVTHEVMLWMARQTEKLNAPLCQVFIRPFSKPWLLLADFREAQDLLLRRGKEFDRSSFTGDLMAPAGGFHIRFNSTDGKWKASRRWLQDLMTPAFLRGVAGPVIYDKTLSLIQLWELKAKLSAGRPFSAALDVHHVALDAVLAFTFGEQIKVSALRPQLDYLAKLDGLEDIVGHVIDDDDDEPVEFPKALLNEFIVSSIEGTVILEKLISSPMPKLALWWMSRKDWYKNIFAVKDRFIREQVGIAIARLGYENKSTPPTNNDTPVHSAVEHMLRREKAIAAKAERQPDFRSQDLVDEIFGNIIAGHDTTSSMLAWMLKFLTDKPSAQSKLRSALYTSYSDAVTERRCPSFVEIASSRIAYLDAVLEESLRLSSISVTREATCDTELLGHHVPKGTVVVLVSNGPSCYSPSFNIDESMRSLTSRAASPRKWDEGSDMKAFEPERWLAKGGNIDTGAVEGDFDPTAGPQLVFGLGTRGCFGKRLAYLEARIITTMIVWNFELLPVPTSLGGYAAVDGVTHRARQCFVRLKNLQ